MGRCSRVKLYRLGPTGNWEDRGTGSASLEWLERSAAYGLIVVPEDESAGNAGPLLVHRVRAQPDMYQLQSESILSWEDFDLGSELALSFQDAEACQALWAHLEHVQASLRAPDADGSDRLEADDGGEGDRGVGGSSSAASSGGTNGGPGVVSPSSSAALGGKHKVAAAVDELESSEAELFRAGAGGVSGSGDGVGSSGVESDICLGSGALPPPEIANLKALAKAVSDLTVSGIRERLTAAVRSADFLPHLFQTFQACEDLEDVESLHHIFHFVRAIVLLADATIYDILFQEENITAVMGALEYDPELPRKQEHRRFLAESVRFKEVVPIADPEVKAKIHQTYFLNYTKDVALARSLDDATYSALTTFAMYNAVEVLAALQQDNPFMTQLFKQLRAGSASEPEWAEALGLLQDMTGQMRHVPLQQRNLLFQTVFGLGLLQVVTKALRYGPEAVQLSATEILMCLLSHSPQQVRQYMVSEKKARAASSSGSASAKDEGLQDEQAAKRLRMAGQDPGAKENKSAQVSLFGYLISFLAGNKDNGVQAQVIDIIRMLLDPDTMNQDVQRSEFLDLFYDDYIEILIDAVTQPTNGSTDSSSSRSDSETERAAANETPAIVITSIVDTLCYCVNNHVYRIKYYILRNAFLLKILQLTKRKQAPLALCAVRLLRTCIGTKEEFYFNQVIKNDLLKPVVELFVANGKRYNLVNSAIIELFHFIYMNGTEALIVYAMENYGSVLLQHTYTNTFQQLRTKYEQLMHPEGPSEDLNTSSAAAAAARDHLRRYRRDDRDLDKDEADYFSENDGDDDMIDDTTAAAADGSGPNASSAQAEGSGGDGSGRGDGAAGSVAQNGRSRADDGDGDNNDDDSKGGSAAPPLLGLIEYNSDEESPEKAEGEDQ